MKLRFGEFPEDHYFLLLTRPFVEWSFKFVGWLIFTSTIHFAHERTGNSALLYLKWFLYLLILGFIGAFVDWVMSFQRYHDHVIRGKKLRKIAASNDEAPREGKSRLAKVVTKIRSIFVLVLSILLSIVLIGAANVATDTVIGALIEFHQKAR